MSFDKKKTMRSAERFLTQGKLRSAIDEYKKIVENDPKDFSTLNILGDLHAKNSDEKEAVKCFMRVAEYYNQQGFSNKAIAIYNKISKIIPDSLEVSGKLAHLYQQRGSNAEARTHYRALAESYEKTGQKIEAIAIWNKIAELDPRDTEVYLKIAENCRKENQMDEAAEAFSKAGLRFSELEQYESAVGAFQKVFEIKDLDIQALQGYVKAQIGLGCADEALSMLKSAMSREPYNRDIQYLLVDCYLDLDQTLDAEELTVKLVEQEPSKYYKLVELVEIYSKENDLDSAIRVLSKASEYLLTGGQAVDYLKWTNEILARNPESIEALQMLVRYHTWQRDETEVKNSLERLAETAQITENHQVESETLARLLMMYPQEPAYSERMNELKFKHGISGDSPPPPVQEDFEAPGLENFSEINEVNETIAVQTENIELVQEFEGDIKVDEEIGFQNLRDMKLNESPTEHEQFETFEQSDSIEENGFQMTTPEGLEINGQESAPHQNDEFVKINDADFVGNDTQTPEVAEAEKPSADPGAKLSLVDELRLHKDIESIEFYLEQEYIDIAAKSLAALEAEFGSREEFAHLRQRLSGVEIAEPEAAAPVEADEQPPQDNFYQTGKLDTAEGIEKFKSAQEAFDSDNAETSVEIEPEIENIPEEEILITEAEEISLIQNEFVEQEVENDFVEQEVENEFVEQEPIEQTSHSIFDDFRNDLGLEEIEEESSDEGGDYETHYQTAIAYKEMGLTEDAIKEFQIASDLVEVNDGTKRFFQCANLLGHCFMTKQMPSLAITWFDRALKTENLEKGETLGLYYELANAYESGEDFDKSIEYFEKIYAEDVEYRDINERLGKLKENLVGA